MFANEEGYMFFEPDCRMGRNIRSHELFAVDETIHTLNPSDYFLNANDKLDDMFTQVRSMLEDAR